MEIWDLYTEKRERTGTTHTRGEKIPNGFYHLVVHVWIRNSEGKYLIAQRSPNKKAFPLKWECVGGAALAGETSIVCALRETKEEVGLDLSPENGKLLFSKARNNDSHFAVEFNDILDVWLFEYNSDSNLKFVPTDEVVTYKWLSVSEIKQLYDNGEFVPTLDYFFSLLQI